MNKLKEQIDNLKQEKAKLYDIAKNSNRYKEESLYYKSVVDDKFKECSSLAEEIICLRTDLDRAHSNYLRLQREQKAAESEKSHSYSLISELHDKDHKLELRDFEEQEEKISNFGERFPVKKMNENKNFNLYGSSGRKKMLPYKLEDIEEDPPIPEQFKILPISKIIISS